LPTPRLPPSFLDFFLQDDKPETPPKALISDYGYLNTMKTLSQLKLAAPPQWIEQCGPLSDHLRSQKPAPWALISDYGFVSGSHF
jgi:hypothetical protein